MARIVYLSWPAGEISGGIKMTFRHVEALCAAGHDACVATPDAQPPAWFQTAAPVIPAEQVVPEHDVLVFPENHASILEGYASWPNRKIVFCQNQYMMFRALKGRQDYRAFGVDAVICPSQFAAAYCRRRCPAHAIYIVPNYIDRERFRPSAPKQWRIAFAPQKRPFEAGVIQDLFSAAYPAFRGVPWVVLNGLSEANVAIALGESALYLSLARFESLGLSVLEAMSAGCVVAGFTGLGGREYMTAANGFWAAEDDCLEATDQLARAATLYREGGDRLHEFNESASRTVAQFAKDRFVERLCACWDAILTR